MPDSDPRCRFCGALLKVTFVDLGMSPPCESYITPEQMHRGEVYYPLHVRLCTECLLVQLDQYQDVKDIFTEYAYFSSFSVSWLKHAEAYSEKMADLLGLDERSFVIEVASNDGYLLQYLMRRRVPVLGIEPAANVAKAAVEKGVPTLVRFFGSALAQELSRENRQADLVIGNNVLAQVPEINDFVEGLRLILKPNGVLTLEFPHLLRLIQHCEFDTIYHEHFSYFSLVTAKRILEANGMRVFDVDEIPTHGGSLRVYACRQESERWLPEPRVCEVLEMERSFGLMSEDGYKGFAAKVKHSKLALVGFLVEAAEQGKRVAGYGAPGKSATLLHYCGIGKDLIEFTVDRNPYKQGRFLPGTRIPIYHPDRLGETKPDYIVILPWNLKDEIVAQLDYVREWGGRLVVPIPELAIWP